LKDETVFRNNGPRIMKQENPVFCVNPSIIVTMNDEMARQLVATLDAFIKMGNEIPPSVFALKQTLINDLNNH
jgi:hypothetical protein